MESSGVTVSPIIAIVAGQPYTEWPTDLFIPPDALEVLMDTFSGPLDLLLYLIRKQNLDILDIPIVRITEQYMRYIQFIGEHRLELAADYLVMAALLAEIKSRMLLPPASDESNETIEEDPRMALVRRLQAYELFKAAALEIDALPRYERDVFQVQVSFEKDHVVKAHPDVKLQALITALAGILLHQKRFVHHQISREPMSVRDRMNIILQRLEQEGSANFSTFVKRQEGRMGLVITLLAILELSRQSLLTIIQVLNFSEIHLKAVSNG